MADHARAARMAKRIMTIVAQALESQVKDPRVKLVTVTDCKVTGDLHDATIFYTVRGESIGDAPDIDRAAEGLKRASGQLRSIVGAQLGVRFTPTLSFSYDAMPEASAHMESLLARARQRDEELKKLAEGATPAGDANPYKTEDED
ncbi:MAG: 30S ribosome-binding factor RbfA [Corynebacterium sp.]|nr:30S ribosome-binding factor RbfA [Corynebacterium sp.]